MSGPRSHRRWRKLRAQVLAENNWICALCGKPGADTVDHIVELVRGGAMWDPSNLRPMHGRKTADCRGNFSLGQDHRKNVTPSRDWF